MIAFEISRNDHVLAVVGARDVIGLHAVLMACGDLSGSDDVVRFFNISALASANGSKENTTMHHTWNIAPTEGDFDVGDTLSIRIIRTECPTPPTTSEELEDADEEQDAEQPGADQSATKSTVKVPTEVQPPPPTSKDAPR